MSLDASERRRSNEGVEGSREAGGRRSEVELRSDSDSVIGSVVLLIRPCVDFVSLRVEVGKRRG